MSVEAKISCIMIQVIISDALPEWMVEEDKFMQCMHHCPLFNKCYTRAGTGCKRLGGAIIPKIRL